MWHKNNYKYSERQIQPVRKTTIYLGLKVILFIGTIFIFMVRGHAQPNDANMTGSFNQ